MLLKGDSRTRPLGRLPSKQRSDTARGPELMSFRRKTGIMGHNRNMKKKKNMVERRQHRSSFTGHLM
jgi:hypothetical protein